MMQGADFFLFRGEATIVCPCLVCGEVRCSYEALEAHYDACHPLYVVPCHLCHNRFTDNLHWEQHDLYYHVWNIV